MSTSKTQRRPKTKTSPEALKASEKPRAVKDLLGNGGTHDRPVFSFALIDRDYDGSWGWHLLTESESIRILNFFLEVATLTWNEVRSLTASGRKRHHYQDVQSLCNDARARIASKKFDDISDRMFRFRLDGANRLWGFEEQGIFYVVWWDPDHKVYPTERSS